MDRKKNFVVRVFGVRVHSDADALRHVDQVRGRVEPRPAAGGYPDRRERRRRRALSIRARDEHRRKRALGAPEPAADFVDRRQPELDPPQRERVEPRETGMVNLRLPAAVSRLPPR